MKNVISKVIDFLKPVVKLSSNPYFPTLPSFDGPPIFLY